MSNSKFQGADFKTEAELIAEGASAEQLLTDDKIYITVNGINKTLDNAIASGDLGGGGSGSLNTDFQPFVDVNRSTLIPTNTPGTPAPGSYYTSIIGKKAIPDLSQDLSSHFGVNRIPVQQAVAMSDESGPAGQTVLQPLNDTFNQLRIYGPAVNQVAASGPRVLVNPGGVIEITFFGTALNIIPEAGTGGILNLNYQLNGGTAIVFVNTTFSTVLAARQYPPNNVIPVISGLTLGIHTITINVLGLTGFGFNGFEVVNSSINVRTNAGVGFIQGSEKQLMLPSVINYVNGVTGTRGGRIVGYLDDSGSLVRAFTPTNITTQILAAADHANEDIAQVVYPREYGSGQNGVDFSVSVGNTEIPNSAFTLEDGSFNLVGRSTSFVNEGLGFAINGATLSVRFIGTGLDIDNVDDANGGTDNYTISIDGGASTLFRAVGSTTRRITKIVSGLPYGSHVVHFTRVTSATFSPRFFKFIVYQPKKPTIPENSIELYDYNVVANYVPTTLTGILNTSEGIIDKFSQREIGYVGTWTLNLNTLVTGGYNASSSTNTSTFRYTFFGTGLEILGYAGTSATLTVNLNGVTFTGAATALGAASTWTPGTGTWVVGSQVGSRLQISGLPLQLHTIIITLTANTGGFNFQGMAIQNPTHFVKRNGPISLQSTLRVGSQNTGDVRKLTSVKEIKAIDKNVVRARGTTSDPTVPLIGGGNPPTPIAQLSATIISRSGKVRVSYMTRVSNNTTGGIAATAIYVNDGSDVVEPIHQFYLANALTTLSESIVLSVEPNQETVIRVHFRTNPGIATAQGTIRTLTVEEI